MRKISIMTAFALIGAAAVAACGTVSGVGKDLQAAGRGLEKISAEAQASNSPKKTATAKAKSSKTTKTAANTSTEKKKTETKKKLLGGD